MAKVNPNILVPAVGAGVLSGGAGQQFGCPKEDETFHCKLSRFVGDIKNILFLLLVLFFIYWVAKTYGPKMSG
jgi:hypothetical protein